MFKKRDHKNIVFELTGPEGADFRNLKINSWFDGSFHSRHAYGQSDKRKRKSLHFFVKVIGLEDDKAPARNWGFTKRRCKECKRTR